MAGWGQASFVSEEILAQLDIKHGTETSIWFGVKTILKVKPAQRSNSDIAGSPVPKKTPSQHLQSQLDAEHNLF